MKSICRFLAVARRGWLLLGFLSGLFCAVGAADPNDNDRNNAPAPQIVKPYVKGEMPTAEELLARCFRVFDGADSWTARITLRAAAANQPAGETYVGTLAVENGRLRASLRSSADRQGQFCLLVSDKQTLAWWQPTAPRGATKANDADGDRARLKRVATAIDLFRVVGLPPGNPRQLSEIAKRYRFSNQGVADAAIAEIYIVKATRKPAGQKPAPTGPAADEKLLIGISVANSHPTQAISQSADGGWRSITLETIEPKAAPEEPSFPDKPPAGAIVLDLNAEKAPPAGIKNPIPLGPESIARGKRLYQADCVVCHSIDGTGRDSDVTDNAADLTDTTRWLSDGSEAATFLAIRDGAGDEMPGYADEYGDDKKIWDLVNYIRSLQKQK